MHVCIQGKIPVCILTSLCSLTLFRCLVLCHRLHDPLVGLTHLILFLRTLVSRLCAAILFLWTLASWPKNVTLRLPLAAITCRSYILPAMFIGAAYCYFFVQVLVGLLRLDLSLVCWLPLRGWGEYVSTGSCARPHKLPVLFSSCPAL